ncbi:MAG: hypothetical protein O7F08_05040 [Deltaproteobacteria bacterium]|nr:hypothetical protein [Deltaproteobacteria bacterium]
MDVRISDLCDLPFEDGELDVVCGLELRASRSMFRYFGGFLVAVLRKHA